MLKEAQDIFDQVYLVDRKNDDPEQFRAIGWCRATSEEEQSYAENV